MGTARSPRDRSLGWHLHLSLPLGTPQPEPAAWQPQGQELGFGVFLGVGVRVSGVSGAQGCRGVPVSLSPQDGGPAPHPGRSLCPPRRSPSRWPPPRRRGQPRPSAVRPRPRSPPIGPGAVTSPRVSRESRAWGGGGGGVLGGAGGLAEGRREPQRERQPARGPGGGAARPGPPSGNRWLPGSAGPRGRPGRGRRRARRRGSPRGDRGEPRPAPPPTTLPRVFVRQPLCRSRPFAD